MESFLSISLVCTLKKFFSAISVSFLIRVGARSPSSADARHSLSRHLGQLLQKCFARNVYS